MNGNPSFKIRKVLLSTGELGDEVVISTSDNKEIYECCPIGHTYMIQN